MTTLQPTRRWFQFSLRTLLIFVTLCAFACSWLAVKMKQAERQRKAVEAIEAFGGTVTWSKPSGPAWLRSVLGPDVFSNITGVNFNLTAVTDAELELLKGLSQLQEVRISSTKITDAGIGTLEGLTQLQTLSLAWTKVTDAGLKHLSGLSQLQELWLQHSQITDAGLQHLTGLSQLQKLLLTSTQVTDEGVKKLQQALPNCQIIHF